MASFLAHAKISDHLQELANACSWGKFPGPASAAPTWSSWAAAAADRRLPACALLRHDSHGIRTAPHADYGVPLSWRRKAAFGLAEGLGSFLPVTVIHEVAGPEATGLVVVNGILIVLFGVTGAGTATFRAVAPRSSRRPSRWASDLFVTFIRFADSGFVPATAAGPGSSRAPTGPSPRFAPCVHRGAAGDGIFVARRVQDGLLIEFVATTVLPAAQWGWWRPDSWFILPGEPSMPCWAGSIRNENMDITAQGAAQEEGVQPCWI